MCLGERDGDRDVRQWHRFKEGLIGKRMLHTDSQSRLVVQGSAQLCIPYASLYCHYSTCGGMCVYKCVSVYLFIWCAHRGLVWAASPLHA